MATVNRRARQFLYLTCLWTTGLNAAPEAFFSCTDYHCDEGMTVTLSDAQWQAVRTLFSGGSTPAGERERIGAAVALLETQVGAITGTWRDLAENRAGRGLPGQLDCIAESKNTTTYLQLLANAGLLEWHDIEDRQVRHRFIFNVHWTAVIRDRDSGTAYAVDAWYGDNGAPPEIQPLEDWRSGKRPDIGQKNLGHQ